MKKITILFFSILLVIICIYPQNFEGYKVFLWDNDAGLEFFNPDDPKGEQRVGYEYNLIKAFGDIGFSEKFGNIIIDNKLPSYDILKEFSSVFIATGHRPVGDDMFTAENISDLMKYMDESGGCVYIEGNNAVEYLSTKYSEFLKGYFGMRLADAGSGQSYYDTIRVDTTFELMRPYKLVYPAGEEPDYGIDEIAVLDPDNPYTHIATVFDSKGKTYKSTSGCTTPYLPDKAAPDWKSYISAVSTGAFASPHRKGKELQLADSTENQLIRASYVRDIMRIFSMGYFLVIDREEGSNAVQEAFERLGVDFKLMKIKPGNSLPGYETLSQYTAVIIYTGSLLYNDIFVSGDTDNLMAYMDYGGNVILSGENVAQAVGKPGEGEYPFLKDYFGVDYLDSKGPGKTHKADPGGIYAGYLDGFEVEYYKDPDLIVPTVTNDGRAEGMGAYVYDGVKSKAMYSGVTFQGNTHRSAFFSFPMSYMRDTDVEALIERTLYKLFNVDMDYMNTLMSQVNINYSRTAGSVSFNISISNPQTGYIVLNRNSDEMDRVHTNTVNTKYKLSSSEPSGFFTIDYNVNGSALSSYVFNIPAEQSDADVYLMDDVLYIETTGDYSSIAVYDIAGNLRMESELQSGGTVQFREFTDFTSGIYFIKLRGNSKNTVRRIMKY